MANREISIRVELDIIRQALETRVNNFDLTVGNVGEEEYEHIAFRRHPRVALQKPTSTSSEQTDLGKEKEPENLYKLTAPLTGIFYRAPDEKKPLDVYVEEGQWVEEGQVVGLIEAMKLFNEIKAEVPGTVFKILAQNGVVVHEGDTLMTLDTSAKPDR